MKGYISEIKNIELLMRSNCNQIGFIPMSRIELQQKRGLIFHQYENDTWIGYLVVGSIKAGESVHIWQECIDKSARGYGSGTKLFFQLLDKCKKLFAHQIILRCREDLVSNYFWKEMGFELIKTIDTNNARNKKINIYRFIVTANIFELPNRITNRTRV